MPHLAALPRLALAIEVQAEIAISSERGPGVGIMADEIAHLSITVTRRRPERPAGNGTDMVLELRDGARVHGPMAGVVHAWRDLVDEQRVGRFVAEVEHLDAEYADI